MVTLLLIAGITVGVLLGYKIGVQRGLKRSYVLIYLNQLTQAVIEMNEDDNIEYDDIVVINREGIGVRK